ncbi:MAG: HIT domain-containing protein [Candidatus Omnitrophica bacterium]|nr:HIT domain-containing protein [Candidatus Omnitrophota bacterium]
MDILWAPWRDAYVTQCSSKNKGCVFCQILREKKDARNFIFLRTEHTFAVLNIYPFNGGHVLVIPNRHVDELEKLSEAERMDFMNTFLRVKALVHKALKPHAFNFGMNSGHLSGAGIPEHLHLHIVPRWSGDVNFMPAIFGTKVIPVALKKVYQALKDADKKRD